MQAMVAGIFPVDFNGINKDGWTQLGTLLNKANLLSDTVISTLGLSTGVNSTPNDAFNVLANIGNVHVWRKTVVAEEEVPAGYKLVDDNTDRTLDDVPNALINLGNTNQRTAYINCADSITVDDGGGISLNSATTHYQANDALNAASWLRDKYIKLYYINDFGNWFGPPALDQNKTYYVPNDAQISVNSATIIVDKLQRVDAYPLTPAGTHITYLTSVNRNAYQEGDDAKEAGYVLGESKEYVCAEEVQTTAFFRVLYAQSVDVSPDGKVSLHEYQTSASFSLANEEASAGFCNSNVRGKFCSFELTNDTGIAQSSIVYIPDSATFTVETEYSKRKLNVNKAQIVTGYPAIPAGTTIKYLGVLGDTGKQISSGSFSGDGSLGREIKLGFRASMVALFRSLGTGPRIDTDETKSWWMIYPYQYDTGPYSTNEEKMYITEKGFIVSYYWDGSVVKWNETGNTYFYIAWE